MYLFIAAPFVLSIVLYFIISRHPFNENILSEMPMKIFVKPLIRIFGGIFTSSP